jgi:hypothetical protein
MSEVSKFVGPRLPGDNVDVILQKIERKSIVMERVLADAQKFGIGLSAEEKAELEKTGKSPTELYATASQNEKYSLVNRMAYLINWQLCEELSHELPEKVGNNIFFCFIGHYDFDEPILVNASPETQEDENALYRFTEDLLDYTKRKIRTIKAHQN